MGRRKPSKRTSLQANADEAARELAKKLGRMLRDGRARLRMSQVQAAERAGLSQSEWGTLELGRAAATVPTPNRAAHAIGGSLEAYVKETSAADQPRDAVHLRHQELIIRLSQPGAWTPLAEEFIDREARTSRAADVLLTRQNPADGVGEYALFDVRDWLDDVGAMVRDFGRRLDALDRYAIARMRDPVSSSVADRRLLRAPRDAAQSPPRRRAPPLLPCPIPRLRPRVAGGAQHSRRATPHATGATVGRRQR